MSSSAPALRPRARVALVAVAVAIVVACGREPGPTAAEVEDPVPPTACLSLGLDDCAVIADAVVGALSLDVRAVSYLEIGPFHCRADACPPTLAARPEGRVMIELRTGEALVVQVSIRDGAPRVVPERKPFVVAVEPRSARLGGQVLVDIELGHCGLSSGIDVDGSLWDPVGFVDADHTDAINSGPARFALTSPTTASLTTARGLTVQFVRRTGPKHLPGCR